MDTLKVVVIGAGSATFGQGSISDILSSKELREFDLTVTLVDIDEAALSRMHRLSLLIKEHYGSKATIEATTDRKEALSGANYVIASVARDRWELWQKDFYTPLAYGFRHIFGENGGPGAAFHTLRSLHLMIPIARDMEELCPDAWLLNFTNPESRVCLAISKLTKVRSVGLCHGVFTTLAAISRILKKPSDQIELTIGGINHFHWALKIRDQASGKDLRPQLDEKLRKSDCGLQPLILRLHKLFGYLTYPAASHPGEYVSFAHDISGPLLLKWGIGSVSRQIGAKASECIYDAEGKAGQPSYDLWSSERAKKIQEVADGRAPLTEKFSAATTELAVPIICDIEFDRGRRELSVNVPNQGSAVSNLPEDMIVEVPAVVDAKGVHPVQVGPLPEAIAAMCRLQGSIQNLLVEAYRQQSKKFLLQALIIDPIVDSADRAEQMMEHMLRSQANYLPELK